MTHVGQSSGNGTHLLHPYHVSGLFHIYYIHSELEVTLGVTTSAVLKLALSDELFPFLSEAFLQKLYIQIEEVLLWLKKGCTDLKSLLLGL